MSPTYDIALSLPLRLRLPPYGIVGLAILILAESLLFLGNPFVQLYFTPLVWTGYILLLDALVFRWRGQSLIASRRREFAAMLPWSIACWCIFELYNLRLQNWTYVGLPENVISRLIGYAWSFATIFPAVLVTAEALHSSPSPPQSRGTALSRGTLILSIAFGIVSLLTPLLLSRETAAQLFGLVWIGFFFLLDPINHIIGRRSIIHEIALRRYQTLFALTLAGLICGVLWEFWNYWASAKWKYSVPLSFAGPKVFEMPLLGYLGFIPFAWEVFAMQQLLLGLFPSISRRSE